MAGTLSRAALEAAHCWEKDDLVPHQPALTEFRRMLRYHQARWRQANGHPIGTQPIRPAPGRPPQRPVGSRLPLDHAVETGANFLTAPALDAARTRTSYIERHQSFDHQRLWADLLSSVTMSFNLFGDLAVDPRMADRAVHQWWPDAPGTVTEVCFAHSPGRLDRSYLGNLVDVDIACVLDLDDGSRGIVGVVAAYHDVNRRQAPKPERLPRYVEVSERAGVFRPGWLDAVNGTDLIHVWLRHMLLHSMLQHGDGDWGWCRLVVVHPSGNTNWADVCSRYHALLGDDSSFASVTIEELLSTDVLPAATRTGFRDRYLPD